MQLVSFLNKLFKEDGFILIDANSKKIHYWKSNKKSTYYTKIIR